MARHRDVHGPDSVPAPPAVQTADPSRPQSGVRSRVPQSPLAPDCRESSRRRGTQPARSPTTTPSTFPLSSARRSVTASTAHGRARKFGGLVVVHRPALPTQRDHAVGGEHPAVAAFGRHEIPLRRHVQPHHPRHPLPQRPADGPRRVGRRAPRRCRPGSRWPMSCTSPAAASSSSPGWRCASSAAVCRAWSSWETGTPGLSHRGRPAGQQFDDLVDARSPRALIGVLRSSARVLIGPMRIWMSSCRPFSPVAGTVAPRALGPPATQPVGGQDGGARARPRRRRALHDLPAPRGSQQAPPWPPPASTTSATAGGRSPSSASAPSLDSEARLHLPGRIRTRGELQLILQNRLRMVDLWKREPAVLRQPVHAPDRRDRPRALGHHAAARAAGLRPRQPPAAAVGAAPHRPLRGCLGRPVRRRDHAHGRDRPRLHRHARERRPAPHRVHLRLRPPVLERHVHRSLQRGRVHGVAQRRGPGADLRLAQAPPADAAVGDARGRRRAGSSRRPRTSPPCPSSSRPIPTPGS